MLWGHRVRGLDAGLEEQVPWRPVRGSARQQVPRSGKNEQRKARAKAGLKAWAEARRL